MHVFRLTLTAGPSHAVYPLGTRVEAICVVDRAEAETAEQLAWERLGELGWVQAEIQKAVTVPADSDTSGLGPSAALAFEHAKEHEVGLIIFSENGGAT